MLSSRRVLCRNMKWGRVLDSGNGTRHVDSLFPPVSSWWHGHQIQNPGVIFESSFSINPEIHPLATLCLDNVTGTILYQAAGAAQQASAEVLVALGRSGCCVAERSCMCELAGDHLT